SFRRLPFCSDLLSQAADVRTAYLAGWNEFRYCSRRLTCARRLLRCMSPVVALSVNFLCCGNWDAIGGKADMPRPRAAYLPVAIDPSRTWARLFGCGARR